MRSISLLLSLFLTFGLSTNCSALPKPQQKSVANESANTTVEAKSLELNERAVQAIQKKDFVAAEDLLKRSLASDEHNVTAAFNLASVYLTLNKNHDAVELLSGYIRQTPTDAGLHARLGDALFASKKINEALIAYEDALKIDPKYPAIRVRLATIYTLSKRLQDAEKVLLLAIEQEPQNGEALSNLSALFLANGKAQESIQTAKRALQVKPSSQVYVTMGAAYETVKDFKNALIAFQRAQDLGNATKEVSQKIENLKKVVS